MKAELALIASLVAFLLALSVVVWPPHVEPRTALAEQLAQVPKEPYSVKDCNFIRTAQENGANVIQCGKTDKDGWRTVLIPVK